MEAQERLMHLAAALYYGRTSSCGTKTDYRSEETAGDAAQATTVKYSRALEAYPCWWCNGWHIGREMTAEEREQFSSDAAFKTVQGNGVQQGNGDTSGEFLHEPGPGQG